MAKQIKVSKQFLADFELIVKHYEFPHDDIEFLRNKARRHYTEINASLAIVAANIRNENRCEVKMSNVNDGAVAADTLGMKSLHKDLTKAVGSICNVDKSDVA